MFENPEAHPELLDRLSHAGSNLDSSGITTYGRLRKFVRSGMAEAGRKAFEAEYATYYRLNSGGLTPEYRSAYFGHLYAFKKEQTDDPHTPILMALFPFPTWKGNKVVAASFVSKLVAIHDEAQPLYDRNVREFFGLGVPDLGSHEFRIAGFVQNLRCIRRIYDIWSRTSSISGIIDRVRIEYPDLGDVHSHRICDFLVWQAASTMQAERKGVDAEQDLGASTPE